MYKNGAPIPFHLVKQDLLKCQIFFNSVVLHQKPMKSEDTSKYHSSEIIIQEKL